MNLVVLDTSIIIDVLRSRQAGRAAIAWLQQQEEEPRQVISSVTRGELESLKVQQSWAASRTQSLNAFLANTTAVDILEANNELMDAYARIDAYSLGKGFDQNGARKPGSAITMGKNDLWIAATACLLEAPLITCDRDFDHLNGSFLEVHRF